MRCNYLRLCAFVILFAGEGVLVFAARDNMEISEALGYITAGVSVIILALLWLRTRPIGIEQAHNDLLLAAELARTAVAAAEQLWRSGRMPADDRIDYAMSVLQSQLPGVDVAQLQASIEAAVYWLRVAHRGAAEAG